MDSKDDTPGTFPKQTATKEEVAGGVAAEADEEEETSKVAEDKAKGPLGPT
jgi:hypothetical protein